MKRTISILGGFAFFLLADSVHAQPVEVDGGLYLGVRGGVTFLKQVDESFFCPEILDDPLTIGVYESFPAQEEVRYLEMNTGYFGAAAIGYTMAFPKSGGDLRFELEGAYRYYKDGETNADWEQFGHVVSNIDGTVTIKSAMLNIYVDFRTPTRFVPYIGLGVGYSRIDVDARLYDAGRAFYGWPFPIVVDQRIYNVSWQAMAGVGYKITSGTIVGLEYRAFRLSNGAFSNLFRYEHLDRLEFDDWLLTLRYTF